MNYHCFSEGQWGHSTHIIKHRKKVSLDNDNVSTALN